MRDPCYMGPYEVSWFLLVVLIIHIHCSCRNFRICHPPPQDWSLVEEHLSPLVMIKDSEEDDMDDVQDERDDLIGVPSPSQHPTSVRFLTSVDQRGVHMFLDH